MPIWCTALQDVVVGISIFSCSTVDSKHQLRMKGLLTDAMDQKEVYAYWEMIQQFMDVSGPLPDVPIFEPFRHRDPVTAEWDQRTGRDPFKWRKDFARILA